MIFSTAEHEFISAANTLLIEKSPLIYFIRAGKSGPIKIGWTNVAVEKRLAQLQTGNHVELHVMGTMVGDEAKERLLHKQFEALRIRQTEWFRPHRDLLWFVKEYCSDVDLW